MSSLPDSVKKEIEQVAVEAVDEFVKEEGVSHDRGLELLADTIDAMLPIGAILEGPLGKSLERGDGPAIEAFLRALLPLIKPKPERILERADRAEKKGHDKRAARLRRRAKRVQQRQGVGHGES